MLYDTKWQKYNYAGVYLPSFVAWLSTKPREEQYDFMEPAKCAVAQYLNDIGNQNCEVLFPVWAHNWLRDLVCPLMDDAISSWTFGALHDRARALMDSAA